MGTIRAWIILIAIVLSFLFTIFSGFTYFADHPCIEYEEVCLERYTYMGYNPALKMSTQQIGYREISCEKPHDRVTERCVKRE